MPLVQGSPLWLDPLPLLISLYWMKRGLQHLGWKMLGHLYQHQGQKHFIWGGRCWDIFISIRDRSIFQNAIHETADLLIHLSVFFPRACCKARVFRNLHSLLSFRDQFLRNRGLTRNHLYGLDVEFRLFLVRR